MHADAVLDMYCSALQYGKSMGFSDAQTSALVGITRSVHQDAIQERQSVATAFKHCNDLLLRHSIERPPKSVALFSLGDMKSLSSWFSTHYFMHYSMYQYVFTTCSEMSFKARSARDLIDTAPALSPLNEAVPEDAHAKMLQEQRAEKEAAEAAKIQQVLPTSSQPYFVPLCDLPLCRHATHRIAGVQNVTAHRRIKHAAKRLNRLVRPCMLSL